jgi:TRAP-type C4-dicarboxylate transport system permease small subunit
MHPVKQTIVFEHQPKKSEVASNVKKLFNFFFGIMDRVVVIGGNAGAVLVLVIVFLTMYEITLRYVFNNAPMIADEITAYMLVAVVSLGLAYRWREGGHVKVEALTSHLSPKARYWLRLFTLSAALFFSAMATKGAFTFVGRTLHYNTISNTWLRVPVIWPQLFIPFGFTLLSIYILLDIGRHLIKRNELIAADGRSQDE